MIGRNAGIDAADFVRANTTPGPVGSVPEIRLRQADEAFELWTRTETDLSAHTLPPPYWAFAWAGGQGLARYVLDNPDSVRGKSVLDFASGSGLVGIAAALAGASSVLCCDIDPYSRAAIEINSLENNVAVEITSADPLARACPITYREAVLAGDVFYERGLADSVLPWLVGCACEGADILVGDPGRHYFPEERFVELACYTIDVTRDLEDSEYKTCKIWALPKIL